MSKILLLLLFIVNFLSYALERFEDVAFKALDKDHKLGRKKLFAEFFKIPAGQRIFVVFQHADE